MERKPVNSTDLVAVGYDAGSRTLEVEFKEGRVYQYLDVPPDVYDGLMCAESLGKYFYAYIITYYRYRRVQ